MQVKYRMDKYLTQEQIDFGNSTNEKNGAISIDTFTYNKLFRNIKNMVADLNSCALSDRSKSCIIYGIHKDRKELNRLFDNMKCNANFRKALSKLGEYHTYQDGDIRDREAKR